MKTRDTKLKDPARGQRRYTSPRLVVYGDLSRLTMAKGGVRNDGGPGVPKTKL
jgi:hypothetical protein